MIAAGHQEFQDDVHPGIKMQPVNAARKLDDAGRQRRENHHD